MFGPELFSCHIRQTNPFASWNDSGVPAIFTRHRALGALWVRRDEMRKFAALAFLATAFLVSACNTVEGIGEDVSSAGDTVADTADDAK